MDIIAFGNWLHCRKFVFCVVGYEILHTHVVGIILTPWML